MATFSKFYLDQNGVKALIAKIVSLYKKNKDANEANKALSEAEIRALAAKAGITLTLNADGKTYTAAFVDGNDTDKTLKALINDLRTGLGAAADTADANGSAFARIAANKANITTNANKIKELGDNLGQKTDAADANGSAFARIAANKADIAANKASIAANKTNIDGLREDLGQKDAAAGDSSAFARIKDLEDKAFENAELVDDGTTTWKIRFTAKNNATKDISLDMSKFVIDGMLDSAELVNLKETDPNVARDEHGKALPGIYLHLAFNAAAKKQDIYVRLKDLVYDQHYKIVNSDDAYATLAVESREVLGGDEFGKSDHIDVTHTLALTDRTKQAVDAVFHAPDAAAQNAAEAGSIEKRLEDAYTTLYGDSKAVVADESAADTALVKKVYDVEQWIKNNALSADATADYAGINSYFDAVVDKEVNGRTTDLPSGKNSWLPGINTLD